MDGEKIERILNESEEKLRMERVLAILLEADLASLGELLEKDKNRKEKG